MLELGEQGDDQGRKRGLRGKSIFANAIRRSKHVLTDICSFQPEVLQRQFKKLLHQGANLRAGRDMNEGLEMEQ